MAQADTGMTEQLKTMFALKGSSTFDVGRFANVGSLNQATYTNAATMGHT